MSEHNPDVHSSTNGSDSIAGSPTESVHSYVRPRPQRVARVTFAPPLLSPASSTTSTSEGFVRPRPRSPQRLSYRSQSSDYLDKYPDEDDISPPRFNSNVLKNYEGVYDPASSDFSEPDIGSDIRHASSTRRRNHSRGRNIPTFAASNASRRLVRPIGLLDDSDDERIKVNHVINVRRSRSVDNYGNKEQKWPGSRVFTHQSSFAQDEKAFLETYRIIQSRLVPRSEDDLHDRAVLTYEEKAESSKTEIRWVHIQSNYMNLELFEMEALRQQNLPEATSILIRSAFRYLRQRNEKSYVHGRFLDPTALSFVARDFDDESLLRQEVASIAFLAFPYFTLEPLRVQDPSSAEPIHPVRSLLQFHYSFHSTGQRDTDQVVCKVREVPDVLHVPQTWMLLVNEDLILSMGPNDLAHIGGEYVSLEKVKAGGAMSQIRLVDSEGKQYFLPKRSCQTWLELISMLSTMEEDNAVLTSFTNGSWSDEYELRLGNELITEANWSEAVLRAAHDITIHIVAKFPWSLPRRLRSSRLYSRTEFARRPGSHYARAASHDHRPRRRSSMYSAPNINMIGDDVLVRHPTYINNWHRDDGNSIRQYHTDAVQRHAWQSDKKPIWLKDLDGFELSIPWRVGGTWRKMQSVIGTKMQQSYESRQAYTSGDYILNGPDGPITPADWDEKVRPGCTVELKFTRPEITGRMSRHRSHRRGSKPVPGDENSASAAGQPFSFTPMPPERIDTSRLIEYPGFSSDGALARDADSKAPRVFNEPASVYDIENVAGGPDLTTKAMQFEPSSSRMPLVLWRHSPLNSDTGIHTSAGQQLGGVPRLPRRSTAPQSFVEDFDEDTVEDSSPNEKTSSVDFADLVYPVRRASGDSRGSSSMTRSDESSLGLTESTKLVSSSQLASPEEPAADAQPDTGTETTPTCPIFAWEVAASDALPPTPIGTSESTFEYKHADRTIRAILEEREAEATLYLLKHEREKKLFDSLPECSRREVLAEMKVVGSHLDRSSASEGSVRKRSTQKKLTVITNAIKTLDAFVPVQYQNIHQYWWIKKFYGALLAMTSRYFSDAYLDRIGGRMASFLEKIRQIHARVSRSVDDQKRTFYLPKALVDVFNPMIIYVCICSQVSDELSPEWRLLQRRARKILQSLQIAEYQLISMIHAGDFSEAKVFRRVNAQDIVTMVTERLVQIPNENPTEKSSSDGFNLLQIYRQYILGLELQARTSPNAEIFDEIQRLREELNIIHTVLDQQLEVLDSLRTVWGSLRYPSHQRRRLVKQMKRDLDELEVMADKASMLLRSMIEVRKESNSKAITIFTIVTVIFLPLSFVTSYLGMNSVDIRDGTFKQSLFWIVALPSAAVLIFTLWIVLKFRQSLRRWWPRRRLRGSLRMIAFRLYGAVTTVPSGSASSRTTRETTIM